MNKINYKKFIAFQLIEIWRIMNGRVKISPNYHFTFFHISKAQEVMFFTIFRKMKKKWEVCCKMKKKNFYWVFLKIQLRCKLFLALKNIIAISLLWRKLFLRKVIDDLFISYLNFGMIILSFKKKLDYWFYYCDDFFFLNFQPSRRMSL